MFAQISFVTLSLLCISQVYGQFYQEPQQLDYEEYSSPNNYEQPYIRVRRQLFGGVSRFPGGGGSQTVGYQTGPVWASISQSSDRRGFTSPITYSRGAEYTSPGGHGISGSFSTQPGIGSQGSIRGQLGILDTANHQVGAWAQHDRSFDKNFKIVGPEANSAGLTYSFKNGNTKLEASGKTNFRNGMKPEHQVGIEVSHAF